MRIVIFGSKHQKTDGQALQSLFTTLDECRQVPCVEHNFYEYLRDRFAIVPRECHILAADEPLRPGDMAVSLGGDGTFLRTARRVAPHDIPILGINTGSLGYLADVTPEQIPHAVRALIAGNLTEESRSMLEVQCHGDDVTVPCRLALNEIAVLKAETASMMTLRTSLDGDYLTTYLGDGLIISTPTGSTAYNLSVGGPILAPQSQSLVITPIAAHSLTMRPIVVNDNSVIDIEMQSRSSSYRLSIDGQSELLPTHARITIRKASHKARILKQPGHTFASTLRSKLMWGIDPR